MHRKAVAAKPRTSAGFQMNWPLAIAMLALGIAIGAFAMYSKSGRNVQAKSGFDPALRGAQLASLYPQVYQVASQFICPCGTCNDGAEDCDCDMPNGAQEVRSFIYAQLMQGHLPPHIIEMVEQKYGHRKGSPVVPNVNKFKPKLEPIIPR